MSTKNIVITIDTSRKMPAGSSVVLVYDEKGKKYYPLTKQELLNYFDEKVESFIINYNARLKNLENKNQEFQNRLENKEQHFEEAIAKINDTMIKMVESTIDVHNEENK